MFELRRGFIRRIQLLVRIEHSDHACVFSLHGGEVPGGISIVILHVAGYNITAKFRDVDSIRILDSEARGKAEGKDRDTCPHSSQ